jgi:hypothetical protein
MKNHAKACSRKIRRGKIMKDVAIKLPKQMLDAVFYAVQSARATQDSIPPPPGGHFVIAEIAATEAIRYLTENPIVPTKREAMQLYNSMDINPTPNDTCENIKYIASEWQRRMFLEKETEDPRRGILIDKLRTFIPAYHKQYGQTLSVTHTPAYSKWADEILSVLDEKKEGK